MKTIQHRTCRFNLKEANDDNGVFEGYASVFDVVDSHKDVVRYGAFTDSIKEHEAAGTRPKLLWQHNHHEPIGVWTDIEERKDGLFKRGQIIDTQRGVDALKLMRGHNGIAAVDGISIGYNVVEESYDEKTKINQLLKVGLWESSIVTFPSNTEARVLEVRAALEAGTFPTIRDFERYLTHDAGFTRSQARTILNQGYKALTQDADPDAIDWTEVLDQLQTRQQDEQRSEGSA